MIKAINSQYVPIYIASEDYRRDVGKASAAERAAMEKMLQEAWSLEDREVFLTSDATCFMLDSKSGKCKGAIRLPKLMEVPKVLEMLDGIAASVGVTPGAPAIPPSEQVRPDRAVKPDELGIYMVSRAIPSGGTWKALPAEDYVILEKAEWEKFLPPADAKVGDSFDIDKEVNDKILVNLYPPSPNRDPETNRIDSKPMRATVVSIKDGIARVRLDNDFKMKHHFLPVKEDQRFIEAKLVGFVDVDLKNRQVQKLRIVTEKATYDNEGFGSAVRSVPPTNAAAKPAASAPASGTEEEAGTSLRRGAPLTAIVLACGAVLIPFLRVIYKKAQRTA